jgi:predicted O-methyltransferase YrrM
MPALSTSLFRIIKFLQHQFSAKGLHSLHSPFVFEFYQEVVCHPYPFSITEILEEERGNYLTDKTVVDFDEKGAGKQSGKRKIADVAGTSLMPASKAGFLLRLCHWLKPATTIELGTCLGLSTAYLAQSSEKVISFEANRAFCLRAQSLWEKLSLKNIEIHQGLIEETLPLMLPNLKENWDLAIIDANHRYKAALQQFHLLKTHRAENACIVLDDIYWSQEMANAWKDIQNDKEVAVSIDLYHFGLVFFRKGIPKQSYRLKW